MSIPFSQGKLQGKERKHVLQAVQEQAKAAARAAIRPVLQEFLETEVCAKLGREKGEARHISSQLREIDGQCGHCGCRDANQFTRDGHYRRGLSTGWGHLSDLRIPMLECQQCQHDVVTQFTILEKYKRFWMDLDQDVLFGSGFCESLRHLQERWSATIEGSVGLRTLNERINQIEALASRVHTEPITDVPPVIQLDGIWVTIQSQHEKIKPDKRHRQRKKRSGKKMVVLVALGFWARGGSGRLSTSSTPACSMVWGKLVGHLARIVFRAAKSPLLARDTLSHFSIRNPLTNVRWVCYLVNMRNDEIKDTMILRVLKALASETRLTILEWLKDPVAHFPPQVDGDLVQDGVCADFIREKLGIAAATASRHLTLLTDVGLLSATRKKGWTFYRRNEQAVQSFIQQIQSHLLKEIL